MPILEGNEENFLECDMECCRYTPARHMDIGLICADCMVGSHGRMWVTSLYFLFSYHGQYSIFVVGGFKVISLRFKFLDFLAITLKKKTI